MLVSQVIMRVLQSHVSILVLVQELDLRIGVIATESSQGATVKQVGKKNS